MIHRLHGSNKPSKGVLRHFNIRGDIGDRCYFDLFCSKISGAKIHGEMSFTYGYNHS